MDWTIGSLFSGIGGIELGLEGLGLGPVLWWKAKAMFLHSAASCRLEGDRAA